MYGAHFFHRSDPFYHDTKIRIEMNAVPIHAEIKTHFSDKSIISNLESCYPVLLK